MTDVSCGGSPKESMRPDGGTGEGAIRSVTRTQPTNFGFSNDDPPSTDFIQLLSTVQRLLAWFFGGVGTRTL